MMMELVFDIVFSFLATIAYVVLFNVPRRYFVSCGITGVVAWLVYKASSGTFSAAAATFLATLAVVFLSRMLTVRMKCPITIFLMAGIIPLVPGAGIYYTVYYMVTGQLSLAAQKGLEAVKIAFAIVLGIVFIVSIPREVFQVHYWKVRKWRKRLKNNRQM